MGVCQCSGYQEQPCGAQYHALTMHLIKYLYHFVERIHRAVTRVTRPMARMRAALALDLGIIYSLSMHNGIRREYCRGGGMVDTTDLKSVGR